MCDALRLYFRPEDARITSQNHYLYFSLIFAPVAELADALDSGSSSLKRVWVQIPSSAPKSFKLWLEALFLCLGF